MLNTTHGFSHSADKRDMIVRPSLSAKEIGHVPHYFCAAIDKKRFRVERLAGLRMQVQAESGFEGIQAKWGIAATPQEIME